MDATRNKIALMTIVRKEVTRFTRIWTQTLLPPVITQSLYFLIFGKFIGSQVGDINGVSYMAFIVPGLVMMAVINSSFANVVSSFFSTKFQRSIEELIVSPTPNWVILAGYVCGGVLRGVIVGTLVFGVSFFFVHPHIERPELIIIFMLLTATVAALGGFLNAVFARKFDDINIFPMFVLTPLTYLGGVFYSIHNLPPFWREISRYNPILYIVNGFRYGFYKLSDISIALSLVILVTLTAVLTYTNLVILDKGTGIKS